MPSRSAGIKFVIVYGDRRGPARLGNLVAWWFEPRGVEKLKLIHPTRDQTIKALESADGFWFWGHGNDGKLHLGSGESLHPDQIPDTVRLEIAILRACYSFLVVESWLRVAKEVWGYTGVTMELWGRIYPIQKR